MKYVKLTESDLRRIIKRTLLENHQDNLLYQEIKAFIRNSNNSPEESVSILRLLADELESHKLRKHETMGRWSKENERGRKFKGLDPDNEY